MYYSVGGVCRMVVLDQAGGWAEEMYKEGIIAKFLPIDFHDESTVFDKCVEHCKTAEQVSFCPCLISSPDCARHNAMPYPPAPDRLCKPWPIRHSGPTCSTCVCAYLRQFATYPCPNLLIAPSAVDVAYKGDSVSLNWRLLLRN